jgi:hypothetical protein
MTKSFFPLAVTKSSLSGRSDFVLPVLRSRYVTLSVFQRHDRRGDRIVSGLEQVSPVNDSQPSGALSFASRSCRHLSMALV